MIHLSRPFKILLNAGHSERTVGAVHGALREYECNMKQALMLQTLLHGYGFEVAIAKNEHDNLVEIGKQAAGYDLFLSLHLNACNAKANYTTVCFDDRNDNQAETIELAHRIAVVVGKALTLPLYSHPQFRQGVMPGHFQVLHAAGKAGCPVCILVEPFFIDCYSEQKTVDENIEKAMMVIAEIVRSTYEQKS